MVYFGTALSTRDQVASAPTAQSNGSFDLSWDPGVVGYVLEGNYQFVASLLTPNGTTVWSETFYVHDTAPFGVLAAFPILLVAILLYELYAVAVIGRKARRPGAQPWQPSAPGSDGSEPDGTDGKSGGTG